MDKCVLLLACLIMTGESQDNTSSKIDMHIEEKRSERLIIKQTIQDKTTKSLLLEFEKSQKAKALTNKLNKTEK